MDNLLTISNMWFSPESVSIMKRESDNFILKDISLSLVRGEKLGIGGNSGSGKTTLAKIIAGILKPQKGKIWYSPEIDFNRKANPIQLLFQNSEEIINPYRKTGDILIEALQIEHKLNREELDKELEHLCKTLLIEQDVLNKKGYQLSGGQRQRIAMARLWAVKPQILILDEPVSAQDVESQANLSSLLSTITVSQNVSLIVISHNRKVLEKVSDRIIELSNGAIISNNF